MMLYVRVVAYELGLGTSHDKAKQVCVCNNTRQAKIRQDKPRADARAEAKGKGKGQRQSQRAKGKGKGTLTDRQKAVQE